MAAKIKSGDRVIVLAGRDKGKGGEVLQVIPDEGRAIVRGVNMVRHHEKQSAQSQGGIIAREAKIDLSNLAIADPRDGKPSRVGFREENGKKVRFAKKSGEVIPEPKKKAS